MKKILLLPFLGVQFCFGSVDEIVRGIRKIDLAQKVYPVLWEKDQLSSVLLVLKKCHDRVKSVEKEEEDKLEKIKEEIKKAELDLVNRGELPNIKLSDKIKSLLDEFKSKRNSIITQNIQEVNKVLIEHLKPWQKTVIGLSEKEPLGWIEFIRYSFLDPLCYEILFSNLKRLDPKAIEGLK